MKKTNSIKALCIPKPCDQDWDKMEGEGLSRHCASCQKSVYDLSGFSNEEAIKFIKSKNGEPSCVRFCKGQLSEINESLNPQHVPSLIKPLLLAATMSTAVACGSINKIEEPIISADTSKYEIITRQINPDSLQTIVVRGIVMNENDKPVYGSVIVLANSSQGCMSNAEGKFELEIKKSSLNNKYIEVRSLGHSEARIELSKVRNSEVKILLAEEQMLMGEVCIEHQPLPNRLLNKVKNIFK